jgi:site-specific DNA-adenine methylase
MKAPFPWYGGKSRVAHLIWQALGNPDHYIEPFAGSLATLLARPPHHLPAKGETVGDLDGHLVNTWRCIQRHPAEMAAEIERLGGAQELTLHAVNREMIATRESIVERLREDVEWCDVIRGARWLWGVAAWVGRGWAADDWEQKPNLGDHGRGVHSPTIRYQIPATLAALASRLRHVRVLCGDWSRLVTRSAAEGLTRPKIGASVALLLDPPYRADGAAQNLYATETDVAQECSEWAYSRGDNPLMRIVLCGLAGEHSPPSGWRVVDSMTLQAGSRGKTRRQDCLYLSPHCYHVEGERPVDPSAEPAPRRGRQGRLW